MTTTHTFSELFTRFFHHKFSLDDFLYLDVKQETKTFQIKSANVSSPSDKLKRYHEFLNTFVFDKFDICDDVCFSYQKEKSVYDCIYPHKDSKYYLSTDLINFFNSIKSEAIKTLLINNIQNLNINDIENYTDKIVDIVSVDGAMPVGLATSAKISNAFLYKFDKKLLEYCKSQSIILTRYSDDLIFSCERSDMFDVLLKYIEVLLEELFQGSIKLNTKKTKIQSKKSKIKLLGVVITPDGNLTVDKKIKSDIEVLFYFYINDKERFKDFLQNKFDGRIGKAFGTLSYINSIDSEFLYSLRKKYGNYIVDGFLHRSIRG